jgi:hypothetical protein
VSFVGDAYSQDGYTFTNTSYQNGAYINWVAYGYPQYNAGPVANIAVAAGHSSNVITNDHGTPFSFSSIGLADVYNQGSGGDVSFTFNHVGGGSDSTTVSLASGVVGLQNFSFNETNLTSVVFTATTTYGGWIQFNNVGVSTAAPEASTWAMMLAGFAGVGFLGYRRSKATIVAA